MRKNNDKDRVQWNTLTLKNFPNKILYLDINVRLIFNPISYTFIYISSYHVVKMQKFGLRIQIYLLYTCRIITTFR